jgi:RHS repeat-associated protein
MQYHAASGLYLTKYRIYEPGTGRWLSRDPIEEVGGINLYAYVENNPLTYTDPTGEFGWAGAIYGGIAGGIGGYITGGWRGALVGAGAGAAIGLINPAASYAAGTSVTWGSVAWSAGTAATASLVGQGVGNLMTGNDPFNLCNYNFGSVAGAAVGGGLGGPVNGLLGRYGPRLLLDPIGRPIRSWATSTPVIQSPAMTLGAIGEGAVTGGGELFGGNFGGLLGCGCD